MRLSHCLEGLPLAFIAPAFVNHGTRPPGETEAFVALGSNLGDRAAALRGAVRGLSEAVRAVHPSPVYESEAHTHRPGQTAPAYLNAVVRLETERTPEALLALAFRLEADAGRERKSGRGEGAPKPWAPRPLDVDVLLCGPATRQTPRLTLPHPRLAERRFVLRPWADLAPNLRVPLPFDETVAMLLDRCRDRAALHAASLTL